MTCMHCPTRTNVPAGPINTAWTSSWSSRRWSSRNQERSKISNRSISHGCACHGKGAMSQQINASSMRTASLHCPQRPVTRNLLQNGTKWQVVGGLQTKSHVLSSANREHPVTFRTCRSFSKTLSGSKDKKGTPPNRSGVP